jgi:TRAP-type C4-dicarboxylate transport system substrate-binding protein
MLTCKLWRATGFMVVLGILAVACAQPARPTASEPARPGASAAVTLRGLSGWERNISYSQPFLQFADRLSQKTNGELQVQYAGPEVVPPFEGLTAVSSGAFDLLYTTPAYYVTNLPESPALQFAVGPCQRYREAGVFDLYDQLHRQKTNSTFLGCAGGGSGFVFLTREPVQSLDYFKGKKMRGDQLRVPILEAVGASPVVIPPAEVYTALERKVVDGIAWPENGILERKFEEVVKYMIKPSWLVVKLGYVMNLDAYNRLPPHLQQALRETIYELEDESESLFKRETEKEQAELQKQGMQILTLPPAEAEKLLKLIDDAAWSAMDKASPEWGPKLREAFARVPAR